MNSRSASTQRGFTLIELMIVVVLMAVLVMLAAPSMSRFIDTQRLRAINAALITDLQYARTEAAARNRLAIVFFDKSGSSLTCYAIVTGDHTICDCKRPPGSICSSNAAQEIKTVQIPRANSITLGVPDTQTLTVMAYDPSTGHLLIYPEDIFVPPVAPFLIDVKNDSIGGFRNAVEVTGRPTVCSPDASMSGVPSCTP